MSKYYVCPNCGLVVVDPGGDSDSFKNGWDSAIDKFTEIYDKWLYAEYGQHLNSESLVKRVANKLKENQHEQI